MRLPKDVKDLILDYYWSYRTTKNKKQMLHELKSTFFFKEIRTFYEIYHNITVNVHC